MGILSVSADLVHKIENTPVQPKSKAAESGDVWVQPSYRLTMKNTATMIVVVVVGQCCLCFDTNTNIF